MATTPQHLLPKRPRDDMYDGTEAQRIARTTAFIKSLRFSKSLRQLRSVTSKAPCPKCGKNRMHVCYDCLVVVHPATHPPPLQLPIDVTVVYHPGELHSKSTSLPASTISPDCIRIVRYPDIPEGLSPSDTLVLYPSASSVTLDSIENLASYKHVVFVDSTWQQSKKIARDPRVVAFKHVRIQRHESLFWRFQDKDPSYLATVEAMYYFLREYTTAMNKRTALGAVGTAPAAASASSPSTSTSSSSSTVAGPSVPSPFYHGEVDDLLFYYINQYILVQQSYAAGGSGSTVGGGATDGGEGDEADATDAKAAPTAAKPDGEASSGRAAVDCSGTPAGGDGEADATAAAVRPEGQRKFTARHFGGYVLAGARWDDLLDNDVHPK